MSDRQGCRSRKVTDKNVALPVPDTDAYVCVFAECSFGAMRHRHCGCGEPLFDSNGFCDICLLEQQGLAHTVRFRYPELDVRNGNAEQWHFVDAIPMGDSPSRNWRHFRSATELPVQIYHRRKDVIGDRHLAGIT